MELKMFLKLFGSVHTTSIRTHDAKFVFVIDVFQDVGQSSERSFIVVKHNIT